MKITYDGGKIISELEEAINKIMKDKGYIWWASGKEFKTGIRDLNFNPPGKTTIASTK